MAFSIENSGLIEPFYENKRRVKCIVRGYLIYTRIYIYIYIYI